VDHECTAGRPAESAGGAGEEEKDVDPAGIGVGPGDVGEGGGGAGCGELADHEDGAPGKAVREMAGGDGQSDDGQGAGKADEAEGHGGAGAAVDFPAYGHSEHLAPDDGKEVA